MKAIFVLGSFFISLQLLAQDSTHLAKDSTLLNKDSTMNALTKGMDTVKKDGKVPVKIFNSERAINANTTEVVPKGKMLFKVAHNFSDIAGKDGGIKKFFGLDVSTDVRIGFDIGLSDRLNVSVAHSKGDVQTMRIKKDTSSNQPPFLTLQSELYELSFKYQLMRQYENDPSHPFALTVFAQTVLSTATVPHDLSTGLPVDNSIGFGKFGDRFSQVIQLIIAKKIGKISLQLNPTLVHYNYVPTFDDPTTFAIGGAARIPLSKRFALLIDYFHPFISNTKKSKYSNIFRVTKFTDPLGIGFEIKTPGHVFHMNFTNTTGLLENQFIPYTTSSWGKGQFRWSFSISRAFVLWREKK